MNNPVTDTHFGISTKEDKFSEVRHKAKMEEIERYRSSKKKKVDKPLYAVDEIVVVSDKSTGAGVLEVKIVDVAPSFTHMKYRYFGIVQRVTFHKNIALVGHIVQVFKKDGGWFDYAVENIDSKDVKWLPVQGSIF